MYTSIDNKRTRYFGLNGIFAIVRCPPNFTVDTIGSTRTHLKIALVQTLTENSGLKPLRQWAPLSEIPPRNFWIPPFSENEHRPLSLSVIYSYYTNLNFCTKVTLDGLKPVKRWKFQLTNLTSSRELSSPITDSTTDLPYTRDIRHRGAREEG